MGWLNKGVKTHYVPAFRLRLRGGLMQDTDIIYVFHCSWTLLPIPHLLGDIIKTESLYRLFLFCPETCISLLFDTITLNISWLQRVMGIHFSPSPNGDLYLCVCPSWFLVTGQPKAFSSVAIWCYCSTEDCASKAGWSDLNLDLVIQVKVRAFQRFVYMISQRFRCL